MRRHFVTFYSPGTFCAEQTTKPIESWDVAEALRLMAGIKERHGATPYGFQFITRERGDDDLDSKVVDESGVHYVDCVVRTLAEIKAESDPCNEILIDNMETNGWDSVVTTTKG